jgi:hypothetical protein
VGFVALPSLSVLFLAIVGGGLGGAAIAGGIAAARNFFTSHLTPQR